ncbi:MAG: Asp-tRNA(Asn)/Glu-tRNA(Gln) amidotransferase subunit GatC [Bacteroidetes bacterium]|nr:Asp-tRNA(Asn)/Glu-tRNA(Gln) amidotransferase subunit GatC [Bacteroidota bacterium]MCB0847009.1 Asp-tRNA(Asn)/Glu-tRNA(Gln) amidotransferase subunit GatC [Bacteroidota bacterium]
MQINDELIDHLAKLSKLNFSEGEKEKMKHDFQQMLDFVDKLQEVNTDDVEPLIHMTKTVNQFRPDQPAQPFTQEEVVKNAPDHDGEHFKVPKVVKK